MVELNSNLIPRISPKTDESHIITGEGYRISILSPSLIRVETRDDNDFLDKATQSVWFRDFYQVQYERRTEKNNLIITTDKVSFYFNLKSLKVTHIVFRDTNKKVSCNNKYNLKGTARTLDFTFGPTRLATGIMSKNGVAIFNDKGLILDDDGVVKYREIKGSDMYIFAYGDNYRECLKDFFKLCGKVPLIPRYSLGNWWSRYRAYTQDEYINLMQRFIDEDIPITIATVDMDWHWVDVNKKFNLNYKSSWGGPGWTGYSWDTDLFPDYRAFLKWLQDHNMKVTLNLHPADGVRVFEDMYKEMAIEMGIDPNSRIDINFDIASPKFINAYFKILHHPYESEGVDFWWMDWQQGTKSAIKGLDPLWSLNHYHFLDNEKDKRPLLLSRYAGVGSHRYPLGFSGDTAMSWKVLNFQPYFTANATNIGYTWWSHDIGGHHLGVRDDELYLRWVEYGIFSPILRLHSTSHDLLGKEPWNYRKDIELFTKDQLRLRHQLIPYLYTMNYLTYSDSRALIEPMYYEYPEVEDAYKVPNQYFFGTELIVCPITRPNSKKLNMGYVDTWLPKGRFTDIFTGNIYTGGKWIRMFRGIESIPVLAKEGAIIPLSNNKGNDSSNPQSMTLMIYRGTSSFTLYEDNGLDNKYLQGEYAKTLMSVEEKDNLTFTINKAEGNNKVIPAKRQYKLMFKDIVSADKITVYINDKPVETIVNTKDCLSLTLDNIKPTDKVVITISEYKVLQNIPYKDAAVKILSRYQAGNIHKMLQYRRLRKADTEVKFIKKLNKLLIPKIVKEAVKEYID